MASSGAGMSKEAWLYAPECLDAASDDFGHLIRRRPAAVCRPGSAPDVAAAVGRAAEQGMPVAARGQGHSVYGRAQAEDGLVIDMSDLNAVHAVEADRVTVGGGATWRSVLDATLPHGLTPPVLTDYLDLSVGGTVSAGGLGGMTFRHGFQSCNVIELEVVTGEGEVVTCSASARPELFDAVRGGLSQYGIITRAVLRLVRAPERVRLHTLSYPDHRAMTADQRRLLSTDRVDFLQGTIRPGRQCVVEVGVGHSAGSPPDDEETLAGLSDLRDRAERVDLPYRELFLRLSKLESHLRAAGTWHHPHPWLHSFVPDAAADGLAAELLADVTQEDLGEFGRILLYPIRPGRVRTPLVRLPEGEVAFLCSLVCFPADDPLLVDRLVKTNRAAYDRIRAIGGHLYPVSAVALTRAGWKDHYGPLWAAVEHAKARFDPRHLLTPGQGMFAE